MLIYEMLKSRLIIYEIVTDLVFKKCLGSVKLVLKQSCSYRLSAVGIS